MPNKTAPFRTLLEMALRSERVQIHFAFCLEPSAAAFYCRWMKRIFLAAALFILGSAAGARSEDAATEERLKQLSGRIEDLIAGQEAQRKQIASLARELDSLREQQGKPNASYAAQDDLKRLWETVKEVDRKRIDDNEKIGAALDKIKKALETSVKPPKA